MNETQLNELLTIAQQNTMIDMNAFDTREEYIELTIKAEQVAQALRNLKSQIIDLGYAQGQQVVNSFIAKYQR